jgi:hypothetical protein
MRLVPGGQRRHGVEDAHAVRLRLEPRRLRAKLDAAAVPDPRTNAAAWSLPLVLAGPLAQRANFSWSQGDAPGAPRSVGNDSQSNAICDLAVRALGMAEVPFMREATKRKTPAAPVRGTSPHSATGAMKRNSVSLPRAARLAAADRPEAAAGAAARTAGAAAAPRCERSRAASSDRRDSGA